MKAIKLKNGIFAPVFLAIFTACAIPFETATSSRPAVQVVYENPAWAPTYYSGVRYYYFPDLEVYYDLQNRDFIYLYNGRWLFSRELPPFYSDYDLFHSYVISLNVKVFQPWHHHHYYVSNYPRFYYRNYYKRHKDCDWIRGFNENDRHPIYRPEYHERGDRDDNYRNNGNREERRDRDDNYNRDSRNNNNREQSYRNENSENRNNSDRDSRYTRNSEETNYYGKRIGKPVGVDRNMREPKSDGRSSGGRR